MSGCLQQTLPAICRATKPHLWGTNTPYGQCFWSFTVSSAGQARRPSSIRAPGDFPLIAISAAHAIDRPGVSSDVNEKLCGLLVGLHRELVAQSPDGTHIIAEGSGHGIQIDRPDLVVDAIRHVVESARRTGNP